MYFEDAGELIVENLLLQGQSLMSDCIQTVSEKLDDGTKEEAGNFKGRSNHCVIWFIVISGW